MTILRRMLFQAARRLGSDPRVRAKAQETFETEVKPRAQAAWRRTKPKLDAARDELRDIAREADPRQNPRAFAAKVKERLAKRDKPE
jgi:hypothetical protein